MRGGRKFGPLKAFSFTRDVDGTRSLTLSPDAIVKALRRRRKKRRSAGKDSPERE